MIDLRLGLTPEDKARSAALAHTRLIDFIAAWWDKAMPARYSDPDDDTQVGPPDHPELMVQELAQEIINLRKRLADALASAAGVPMEWPR